MNWHDLFQEWWKPPSKTEEAKASNAASMINEAVRQTRILDGHNFRVYPTGSYRNNTNIRLGSDVDIAIVLDDAFFYSVPDGYSPSDFGLTGGATYGLAEFRADVGRALAQKFGGDVTLGPKTFDIAGNTVRLPADATPFLQHRQFTGQRNPNGTWQYIEGVELRPVNEPSRRIINWHDDHYANGVQRNDLTGRRFKRVTRILKRLRENMRTAADPNVRAAAAPAASFLIECLVYNAAPSCFDNTRSYYDDVHAVIIDAYSRTKPDSSVDRMQEVNERKRLFGTHQGWTMAQAHEFLLRAWGHVGFK